MELIGFEKVRNGSYLKNYELTYLNKAGREKKFEIVSHRELHGAEDIGKAPSGVSMVAYCKDRMLLLREFRMGVNREIYNLCAGMLEPGESLADCIRRELYEETGLHVREIRKILPPSFAAVALSDVTNHIAFVELEDVPGDSADHSSANEQITAGLYTRDRIKELLKTEMFSSRAQLAAYFFCMGEKCFDYSV